MSEDREGYCFALDQFQQFLCALPRFGGVQIGPVVFQTSRRVEFSFHRSSINGKQNRSGPWQAHEYGLVAGYMAAGFDQFDSWYQFHISLHESVA